MHFGLSFPNFGEFAEPAVLVDLARRAEDAGWDGFFIWDHVVVSDGMPVADPWVVLGAIAQATGRIRIGPMVAALPIRADMGPISVEEVAEMAEYVEEHRIEVGPYDYAIGGAPRSSNELAALAEAGLTWYIGGPDPGGETIDEIREWVSAGPSGYVTG